MSTSYIWFTSTGPPQANQHQHGHHCHLLKFSSQCSRSPLHYESQRWWCAIWSSWTWTTARTSKTLPPYKCLSQSPRVRKVRSVQSIFLISIYCHCLLSLTRPENVKMHLQKNADGCFVKKVIFFITFRVFNQQWIRLLLNQLRETDTTTWIKQSIECFVWRTLASSPSTSIGTPWTDSLSQSSTSLTSSLASHSSSSSSKDFSQGSSPYFLIIKNRALDKLSLNNSEFDRSSLRYRAPLVGHYRLSTSHFLLFHSALRRSFKLQF